MSGPSPLGNDTINTSAVMSLSPETQTLNRGAPQSAPLVPLGDTLSNISSMRIPIETAFNAKPNDGPDGQELADAVRVSITGSEELLADNTEVTVTTKARADDLYQLLHVVLDHLQDRHVYGKRAQIKREFKALLCLPDDSPTTYHLEVQEAFEALKNTLPPNATSSLGKTAPNEVIAGGPKKDGAWGTVADTVEGGLRLLSTATDFIPAPAGSIVKLMAGTGLTIIEMLNNMNANREDTKELSRHIGTLIQTAERFLKPPEGGISESCDAETTKQLQSFLDALETVKTDLIQLEAQGRLKQGVSHKSNKDDLKKWEASINRAFAALQALLSLSSIRLLTKMNDSDALRERDRLIGLLGDGDIGATEKAADPADLMCLPGTRTAVLDLVDQWITNPCGSRIFWISGVAGCGKSAVAATIAGRPRIVPTSIAVFYFVRGNQERNKRVICSLSQQLAQFGHGSLEHFIISGVKSNPNIATSHLTTQFDTLIINPLMKLVQGSQPVILVVDALDEWDNQAAVLKLIELIKEADKVLPPAVRFVLASRNEPHLVRSLDGNSTKRLITRYPLDAVLKTDAGRDIRSYIKKRFAKICADYEIAPDIWPEAGHVDGLVMLSDGLFQWASTVMSYIAAKRPQGRLREILKNSERYRGLDNLYQGVLDMSSREETNERVPRLLQAALGAILTAWVPINVIIVADLCCEDGSTWEETMELLQEEILPSLASMFHIPRNPTRPITVSHKSVLDFLTNKDRCKDSRFYTDLEVQHEQLLHACFRIMESSLKRDICGINDPSKLNEEFQDQVAQHIPPGLRYVCQYWATYLPHSVQNTSEEPLHRLRVFSQQHLLHWLEVMSLTGLMEQVILISHDIQRWLLASSTLSATDKATQKLWADAERFVAMFSDLISTSAAHIYISALRFAPADTEIARQFSTTMVGAVRVTGGLLGRQWPPSLWVTTQQTIAVSYASFSPDGKTILSGSQDGTVCRWDAESGAQKGGPLNAGTGPGPFASFSPDRETFVSGLPDTSVRLWDAKTGARKGPIMWGHTGPVYCASFSPDGMTIVSGSLDCTLRLWDAGSGARKGRTMTGHMDGVLCVSFSPDGMTILSGSRDKTVRQWDAESGTQKGRPMTGHTNGVSCASFSPDGKTILSGSFDHTIRLWDAESGAQKGRTLQDHTDGVLCALFSPDRRTILSGSSDQTMRCRGADEGALRAEPLNGHTKGVSCFVFSPDRRTIISGSYDETVRIWDVKTGALKPQSLSATGTVSELSFSDDGLTLIAKTYNGPRCKWDLMQRVPANSAPGPDQVARDPVFRGCVSSEGWIFHRKTRWFWVPFPYADWLLCGTRLALRHERVMYIIDVSEIMYIVE